MAKKKSATKRSPEILHFLLSPLARVYLKIKFNTKVEVNELNKQEGPFFLIGHHVTAFDAVISGAYSPRMIRFIAGDANWDSKIKKFFFKHLDVIPFSKNTSDVKSVMRLRRVAKQGYPISLYPEGGRNWDGATDTLIPATTKLIKILKLPVYTIFYEGGYMSKPRWGNYFRRGKMILKITKLISAEEVKEKTVDELTEIMTSGISYNEYDWQREHMIKFKGKNKAEHVERLVYKCPNCQAIDSFRSVGNDFTCEHCKITYSINDYGFIEGCQQFDNLVDWNRWQSPIIDSLSKTSFTFKNVDMSIDIIDNKNNHDEHLCDMVLTKDGMSLTHKRESSNPVIQNVTINEIRGISVTFLDWVECFIGEHKYRLKFDATRHTSVKLFYDMITHLKAQSKVETD